MKPCLGKLTVLNFGEYYLDDRLQANPWLIAGSAFGFWFFNGSFTNFLIIFSFVVNFCHFTLLAVPVKFGNCSQVPPILVWNIHIFYRGIFGKSSHHVGTQNFGTLIEKSKIQMSTLINQIQLFHKNSVFSILSNLQISNKNIPPFQKYRI